MKYDSGVFTWWQAHYYSQQGLAIAVGTGGVLAVAKLYNERVGSRHERFTLGSFVRSFIGGGLLFGALYAITPPWCQSAMGFEPIVPGRELILEKMRNLERDGYGPKRWWK